MKKLLFEEEIGLNKINPDSKFYSINPSKLFFSIVLLSIAFQGISFSQVKLNGFGRYLEIANTKSLSNLFTYDLNKDGFVDIAGLDSSQKFLVVHFGKGVNQFEPPIKLKLRTKAGRIHAKDVFTNMITNIVTLNKLDGKIQIYEFRKRSLKFLKEIYVGKYPDDIIIDELDNRFPREIIFYGKNLIGIGIVNLSTKISQIKFIDTKNSYQSVNVFYVNSDSFKDLIALNSKNRELTYFYNKSMLMFSKSIVHKFDYRIDFTLNADYNEDNFQDLIFISNERREIYTMSGTGFGGFNFDKVHKIEYEISKPILSDFTKDNLPDIIFFNSSTDNLFLMCFDENNTLLPPIPILQTSKRDNFSLYQTLKQIGIISTNGENNLLLILNSSLKLQRNNFSVSSSPINVKNFKSIKAPLNNLVWIDRFDNSLVVLERDEFNSPEKIYRYKLKSDYDDFKINLEANNKILVLLFKREYPHFQLLTIDFSNGSSTSQVISLTGEIYDLELQKRDESEEIKIVVINKKSGGFYISMVDPTSINQIILEENFSDSNLIDFTLALSKSQKIFYWHRKNNKLELIEKKFSEDFTTSKKSVLYTSTTSKNCKINMMLADIRSDGYVDLVNAFNNSEQNYLLCLLSNDKEQFMDKFKLDDIKCTDKRLMKQIAEDLNISGRLVFYDENSKSLKSLISLKKGTKLITKTLKQINEINSFTLSSVRRNLVELTYISKRLIKLEII